MLVGAEADKHASLDMAKSHRKNESAPVRSYATPHNIRFQGAKHCGEKSGGKDNTKGSIV